MHRRSTLAGILAVVAAAAGCRADPAPDSAAPTIVAPSVTTAGPASVGATLEDPLGEGAVDADASEVRDALLAEIEAAGGVRVTSTGGPHETTFEVGPSKGLTSPAVRRIFWREDGRSREQLLFPSGRVCVNRAEGDALEGRGEATYVDAVNDVYVAGTIRSSGRPYSCSQTTRSLGYGNFVARALLDLDPITRLGRLMGPDGVLVMTDLGIEATPDGGRARHLRFPGVEVASTEHVATTQDFWVDGNLHLVRAELTSLDPRSGPVVATFAYGDVPKVALPPAEDRGPLVFVPTPPQRDLTVTDPVGDVHDLAPGSWFAPSVDLTSFEASYDSEGRTMAFRIGFEDLRALTHHRARYAQSITVANAGGPGYQDVFFMRGTTPGEEVETRIPAVLSHYGAEVRPCDGASSSVDTNTDTVLLVVPVGCIAPGRHQAQLYVSTSAQRVFPNRSARPVGTDDLRSARSLTAG